jgi:5'-nucleotidase
MTKRPKILVTNDDSIHAKGIRTLIAIARTIGDVTVVASDKSQSGQGHAITMTQPLRMTKVCEEPGYIEYVTNGTPVDCVKLGTKVLMDSKPDLLLSGINHGSNAAINVIYSGTMAAVLEGCIDGIQSIGFSLTNWSSDADFSACVPYVKQIIEKTLREGLKEGVCLNVNIPDVPASEIKGIRVSRQGRGYWDENFDTRTDPRKMEYYWMTGKYVSCEDGNESDEWALDKNYVSVVPMQFDFTAYEQLQNLKKWNWDEID